MSLIFWAHICSENCPGSDLTNKGSFSAVTNLMYRDVCNHPDVLLTIRIYGCLLPLLRILTSLILIFNLEGYFLFNFKNTNDYAILCRTFPPLPFF